MGIPKTIWREEGARARREKCSISLERFLPVVAWAVYLFCPLDAIAEPPREGGGLRSHEVDSDEGAAARKAMEAAVARLNQLGVTNLPIDENRGPDGPAGPDKPDGRGGEGGKGDKIDILLDQAEERGAVFQALLDSIPDDLKPEWLRGSDKSTAAAALGGRSTAAVGRAKKEDGGETSWTIHVGAMTKGEETARPSPAAGRDFE
jgi:hypothetical protein